MPRPPASATMTPLNRERVLRTAVQLADQGGLDSLSMRKLADELGVKAMSLYNHVANKDDLLDAMVDRVIDEINAPKAELPWKDAMRQQALSTYQMLLRHPWAGQPILSRINMGPAMLRTIDACLGCLCRAGFSLPTADHIHNALNSYTYGFALQQLNFPIATTDYASMAEQHIEAIPAQQYPWLHQLAQLIIDGQHDGINPFEFGLDLLLNSLEQMGNKAQPNPSPLSVQKVSQ